MLSEEFPSLTPIHFFALKVDCHYCDPKKSGELEDAHILPAVEGLCGEDSFATVAMGWNNEGLHFNVLVNKPAERSYYPSVDRGDSVELFIDTRNLKSAGFNTRFCHHFFFLPQAVEGHVAGEITRFRTEDQHELCDSKDLKMHCLVKRNSYHLKIFLPAHCLVGYDPDQFDRLGFSYRINRVGGEPQHFSVTTSEFSIESQPSLWSHMRLVHENATIRKASWFRR